MQTQKIVTDTYAKIQDKNRKKCGLMLIKKESSYIMSAQGMKKPGVYDTGFFLQQSHLLASLDKIDAAIFPYCESILQVQKDGYYG